MCSLVMSLFSRDYIKMEIDQLKYQQCFNLLARVQQLYSAWFLDGRTSILVFFYIWAGSPNIKEKSKSGSRGQVMPE